MNLPIHIDWMMLIVEESLRDILTYMGQVEQMIDQKDTNDPPKDRAEERRKSNILYYSRLKKQSSALNDCTT